MMGWGVFIGLWILGNSIERGCEIIAKAMKGEVKE